MDEQKPVRAGRRHRSRAEAEQLVAEFKASGLSRREFCRRRELSVATFSRYVQQRRRAQAEAEAAGVNLIPVELCRTRRAAQGEDSGLAVALSGGRRIEVARGFDAGTLMQLLGVLERF